MWMKGHEATVWEKGRLGETGLSQQSAVRVGVNAL